MGVRALLRRLGSDRLTALALSVTIVLSLTLLAAGPIYADAIAIGSLQRSVTAAGPDQTAIDVNTRLTPDKLAGADAHVEAGLSTAVQPLAGELHTFARADGVLEFPGQNPDAERVDVADLVWVESLEEHATIVSGGWPEHAASGHTAVAADARVLAELSLEVGQVLNLVPRSGRSEAFDVRIVGSYSIDDPLDPFWHRRDRFVTGLAESPLFRTAALVVHRSTLLERASSRIRASWLLLPSFEQIQPADVQPIRRRIIALNESLDMPGTGDELGLDFEVRSGAPIVLARSERSQTVARAAVFAVVLQLALLAAYALVLVAGLTVDARSAESVMLRARGASASQLLRTSLLESLILVGPAAVLAVPLAAVVLGIFDNFGPLASIELRIEPRPVPLAWWVVGIAAIVTVVLLSAPTYRAARTAEKAGQRHRRQRSAAGIQRAGIDIAVLVLAALAFWQLATLGDQRASTARGRFGVDPLLIVAPTFVLVAGSLLALRVVPALVGLSERQVRRSTSIVAALPGWQLARRPARYSRTALLLIMAVAIGTFAVAYEQTWTDSQAEQAEHQVGAAVRVAPNRKTGDSLDDLHLVAAHEQLTPVTQSAAVVRGDATLPGSERAGRFVAIDAARTLDGGDISDPDLVEGLRRLVEGRPTVPALTVSGTPARFELEIRLSPDPEPPPKEPDEPDDSEATEDIPEPEPFAPGRLVLLVQDSAGALHRIDMGVLTEGDQTLVAELTAGASTGEPITPQYPLSIVEIELRTSTSTLRPRSGSFEIVEFRAVDENQVSEPVDLSTQPWRFDTTTVGFVRDPPTISPAPSQPPGGLGLEIATGFGSPSAPSIFGIRAAGADIDTVIPAIATSRWLDESGTSVGDEVAIRGIRADPVRVNVVAAVEAVPTIDPNRTDTLVVDFPTLQATELEPGRAPRVASEHWLSLVDENGTVEAGLIAAPISAVQVLEQRQRRIELTSDAPALGVIGALSLGFLVAALFGLVGFVVTAVVSARERRSEFALLRSLGLSLRQLRTWLAIEHLVLITFSIVFGLLLGLTLAALVLPLVSLTQAGEAVYPELVVRYPWRRIALLVSGLLAGLALAMLFIDRLAHRLTLGSVLREGLET